MIIETIDPKYTEKFPNGRTVEVCPLTPLVRKRLFAFFMRVLDEMPDESVEAFKSENYDIRNIVKLSSTIIEYLEKNGYLEEFIAIIIRDKNVSDRDKDISEMKEFLELNCSPSKEVKIFADFFGIIPIEDTLDMFQLMRSNLKKSLNSLNPERN